MRNRGILFLLVAGASGVGIGLALAPRPAAMADEPAARAAPKYEYGQLSAVYGPAGRASSPGRGRGRARP